MTKNRVPCVKPFIGEVSCFFFIEIQNNVVICFFPTVILMTSCMVESINFSCQQMTAEFFKISTVGKTANFTAEAEF